MDKAENQKGSAPGVMRRMGADFASGARIAAPVLKRAGLGIGDWLARIGWGKFFLLSILVMIAGGVLNSLLFHRSQVVVDHGTGPSDRVNVIVSQGPDGVRVSPPGLAAPPVPPHLPKPSVPRGLMPTPPAAPAAPSAAPPSGVQLDSHGVRIFSKKDGKNATVVIDEQGIHIEEGIHALPEIDSSGKAIVIPPDLSSDPEKAVEAVEAVREKVEEIVNNQIASQVARQTRVYKEKSSDWFVMSLVFLIMAGVIVKVVLGSKQKAETRAQQASATAADEGLKRQLAEAQLKMMQAQVEPHFLFNTMASIDHLIETDPPR